MQKKEIFVRVIGIPKVAMHFFKIPITSVRLQVTQNLMTTL